MAFRIHVTAIRDCPAEEVREVFSRRLKRTCNGEEQCATIATAEHNGWVWFSSSVWFVSAKDLNRGLCELARPALQFTTSDGDRWYLTVHGGPGGQEHYLHEFNYHSAVPDPAEDAEYQANLDEQVKPVIDPRLAFLEDERPPGPERPRSPFDGVADELAEMGGRVPIELREELAPLPYSEAMRRFREWHAERILASLSAAGIPHDSAAVRSVLLWEPITENEHGHDLGNLPRLLAVLGLGGHWDEWVRQAEMPPEPEPEPEPEVEEQEPPEPEDYIRPVLAITDAAPLTSVAGGPVRLPLGLMTVVRFFPEASARLDTAGFVLTVTLPPDFDRSDLAIPETPGQLEMTPNGFRIGLLNHGWFNKRELRRLLGEHFAELLYHLPDGSTLECDFAREGKPTLTQRYRGTVVDGRWHIDETYPALNRGSFVGGLKLATRWNQKSFRARDEAEAEAIIAAAKQDDWSYAPITRKGLTLRMKDDIAGNFAKLIFRLRYRDAWNLTPLFEEIEEQRLQQQEMARQMRRAGAEAARRRAAPHDEEVLFQGKQSRYWRSDFTQLTDLEQEPREKFDATLAELGFSVIGDLVAKKQRDILMRTYVSADGITYGILMAKRTMYLGWEFFTRFADGSTLTTTTNGAVDSHPEVGIYYKICPGLDAAALHAKHRWGIERFRSHRAVEPVAPEMTLLGVARELDAAFARQARGKAEK